MKTQLPDKLQGVNKYHVGLVTNEKINQLIDYLAELTEVVEGKHQAELAEGYREILGIKECKSGCGCKPHESYHPGGQCVWVDKEYLEKSEIEALALTRGIDISDKTDTNA